MKQQLTWEIKFRKWEVETTKSWMNVRLHFGSNLSKMKGGRFTKLQNYKITKLQKKVG